MMTFIKMSQGRGTKADAVTRNFFKEIAVGLGVLFLFLKPPVISRINYTYKSWQYILDLKNLRILKTYLAQSFT